MRNTTDNELARTQPEAAAEFTDRLAGLEMEQWLTVAASAEQEAPARSSALALTEALINDSGLGVEAWSVLDDVTACAPDVASRVTTRRMLILLAAAHQAANAAALALLVRPLLHPGDFDVLYRPFASVLPL
jgi:hypothetical protein